MERVTEGALGIKHEVKVALATLLPPLEATLHDRISRLEHNYSGFKAALEVITHESYTADSLRCSQS